MPLASTSELATIDSAGGVPLCRLTSASQLLALHDDLLNKDSVSAFYRANGAAMINGERPYDPSKLQALGLGDMSNNNFGEAQALRDAALAPYIDMISSVPRLVDIDLDLPDASMAHEMSGIVSEEFDWMVKNWDSFHTNNQLLAKFFVEDGVGVAMYPDDVTWQWNAISQGRFLVPRETPIDDQQIEFASVSEYKSATSLFNYIRDEHAAIECGWNVNAVKKAIHQAHKNPGKWSKWANHWEDFVLKNKENNIHQSEYARIELIYGIVREFDGSISVMVASKNCSDEFLYYRKSEYSNINDVAVLFTYGVGEGTYHSVRGLKTRMYYPVQHSNRMLNRMVDAAEFAASPMLQADGDNEISMQFTRVGPFAIVPPGFKEMNVQVPDMSRTLLPVYQQMQQLLANNTGTYQGRPNPMNVSRDVTAEEIKRINYNESILGTASMNLFYVPYTKLWASCYRRTVSERMNAKVKGGELAMEFFKRCMKRGVKPEMMRRIREIQAVRAVGSGSPQVRQMHTEQILAWSGSFDEVGKKNAFRDAIAAITGDYRIADRYVPRMETRNTLDLDIAYLENEVLRNGRMPVVTISQNHFEHFRAVVEGLIAPYLEGMKSGDIPLQDAVAVLRPAVDHASEHAMAMAEDRLRRQEVAAARKILNDVAGQVASYERGLLNQLEAQQMQAQQGPQDDPKTQLELAKLQMQLQKQQQDIEASQIKHRQQMEYLDKQIAMKDMETSGRMAIERAKAEALITGKMPPIPRGAAQMA